MKEIEMEKEVRPSLSAEDMILYIRDPQTSTRKLLEMINPAMWQDTESTCTNKWPVNTPTTNVQRKKLWI